MKKGLKIGLIACISVRVVGGAWAGLTKAGVIPNRFGIEALCPNSRNTPVILDDPIYNDEENVYDIVINNDGAKNDLLNQTIPHPITDEDLAVFKKPIIYLYPTKETEVNVTLGAPENLSHTYPKYNPNNGRNVVAQSNGDLEDIDTGRKLYALYREGKTYAEDDFNEGFVVKGEDIIPFLEEKLSVLGLNEREAEEFIVYWLPQMENNEYNLIRFETKEEQDENMPLNITPTPDTIIRVMMDWKAIDEPIDIPEQELTTPERTGFTVVEWGGSPRN